MLARCRNVEDRIKHAAYAQPGEGRHVDEGNGRKKRRPLEHDSAPAFGGVGVLLWYQIPLVHRHDETRATFPRACGDAQVLRVKPIGGIHDEHADVRPLDGALAAQRRIELNLILYFRSLS